MSNEDFQAWELEHTMERIERDLAAIVRSLRVAVVLLGAILLTLIERIIQSA